MTSAFERQKKDKAFKPFYMAQNFNGTL